MGLQQAHDITVAACQTAAQHMWDTGGRCDVNKTLISEASGDLLLAQQVSMLLSRKHVVNVNRKFNLKFVVVCWGVWGSC